MTIESQRPTTWAFILRIILGLWGLLYVVEAMHTYLTMPEINTTTWLDGIMGLLMIIAALTFAEFGDPKKLIIETDYVCTDEGSSLIRSAYWHKIDHLTLTRFSIRIKYHSSTVEKFKLPYVTKKKYSKIKEMLQRKGEANQFSFSEKAWWKPSI